jgi:hypothetical protein
MRVAVGYLWHFGSTTLHKFWVAFHLMRWVFSDYLRALEHDDIPPLLLWLELVKRALLHDLSKYRRDEAQGFARTIHRLGSTPYGTDAYKELLREIKPSIQRHYSRNRHHPEWHADGYEGMSRIDRIEMVADWGAAVRRHKDGDLERSITTNAERFGYGDNETIFLRSTARRMRLL